MDLFEDKTQAERNADVTDEWMKALAKSGISSFLVVDGGNGLLCYGPEDGFLEYVLSCVKSVVTEIESTAWFKENRSRLEWDADSFKVRVVDSS